MDVAMREDLVAAGMPAAQADVLASHMPEWPDWSQFATKADLQELATKADLKDLDQKIQGQMLDLQREMVDLQRQMVSLNTNLQGQLAAIKGGLVWRLWVPVGTSISVAILATVLTIFVP